MITKEKTFESKFVIMDSIYRGYPFGQVRPISRVSGTRVYYLTGEDYQKEKYTMTPMGFCDTQEEVDRIREFSKNAAERLWAFEKQINKEKNAFFTNVVTVG
jgi:hypothetical protein